jgi:RHS repeat-associated protein
VSEDDSCNPSNATPCWQDAFSGLNTEASEYSTVTRSSNSDILINPQTATRTTTTNWTPVNVPGGTWLPKLYSSKTVTDAPCYYAPCTVTTSFSFNTTNGFLNSTSVTDPAYGTLANTRVMDPMTGNARFESLSATFDSKTYTNTRTFRSGLVESVRRTAPTNVAWKSFDVTRDETTGLITTSRDPNGLAATYAYDSLSRLQSVTPPGELTTTYCYKGWNTTNEMSTVFAKRGGSSCEESDGEPGTSHGPFDAYQYDGLGRLRREMRRLPNTLATGSYFSFRETWYNAAGLVAFESEWTPCGVSPSATSVRSCFAATATKGTTYSNFDFLGRARSIQQADNSVITKSFADPDGIPNSDFTEMVSRSVSGVTVNSGARKDILGRLLIVAEPKRVDGPGNTGPLTFYRYDIHDQVAEVKAQPLPPLGDARQQLRLFARNSFGFLTSETHPETGVSPTTYGSFTALGQPQSMTSGSGADAVTRTTTYDALGRVRTVSSGSIYLDSRWDGENQPRTDKPFGRLTHQLSYNPGTAGKEQIEEWFTYDGPGGRLSNRAVTISGTGFPTLSTQESWAYDSYGNTIRHARPASAGERAFVESRTIRAGHLTEVRGNGLPVVRDIQYGAAGQLQGYTTGPGTSNDIVTVIDPDPSGMARPGSISATRGGPPLFETGTYAWDGAGNILAMGSETFAYDARSRLTQAGATTFQYDDFGNLTGTPTDETWTVDPETNRVSGHDYDSRGNVLSTGTETYTWDALNRMTSQASLGQSYRYAYDGAGERLVRSASSGSRTFTFRNPEGQVTTELLTGGVRARENVFLGSLLVGSLGSCGVGGTESGWTYYSSDHLGSPRLFSRFRNATTEERRYTPYGREAVGLDSDQSQRIRFAAMERDPESENRYYDHARSHDARFGRFLSMDPAPGNPADPASWNRYTYARNNPLRFVDPDGKAAMAALLIPAAQAMAGMAISYVVVDQAFRAFTGRGVDSAFSPTAYQFERSFAQSPLLLSDQANDGSKPPGAGQGEAEGEPTARPDVELSGGRSGEKVKNLTGPADSAVKGGGERIFVTDGQGRVVKDITKDRTKPVIPGKGFGPKQPPTPQELGLLDRVLKLFRKAE